MSIADLYTPGFKQRNRAHFASIVRIALADNEISHEEKAFIDRLAVNLEIDSEVVSEIQNAPEKYKINPPADKNSRLERLYDLSRMVFADHIADDEEKKLLKKIVIGLGFESNDATEIVEKALSMVDDGIDKEDFVSIFTVG